MNLKRNELDHKSILARPYFVLAMIASLMMLLSACGTVSPQADLSLQGLSAVKPVPLTKAGSNQLFAQLGNDKDLMADVSQAFEKNPRQALESVLILTNKQQRNLDKLSNANIELMTQPLRNMLSTTLAISNGFIVAPQSISTQSDVKYYLQHYNRGVPTGKFHLVDPWLIMELKLIIIQNGGNPTPEAIDDLYDRL